MQIPFAEAALNRIRGQRDLDVPEDLDLYEDIDDRVGRNGLVPRHSRP